MVLSSSERQKLFLERKKLELGDDGFKAWSAAKRRESRKREAKRLHVPDSNINVNQEMLDKLTEQLKATVKRLHEDSKSITLVEQKRILENKIIDISKILNCKELEAKLEQTKKKGGKDLKSANQFIKSVKNLYLKMFNKTWNCKDVDWLLNVDNVYKSIMRVYSGSTQATTLSNVNSFVMRIDQLKTVAPQYMKLHKERKPKEEKKRLKQGLKPEWRDKLRGRKWPDYAKLLNTLDFTKIYDKALMGLFVLRPPRRSGFIYDIKRQPVNYKGNGHENFITTDKKGNPKYFVLQRYKTSEVHKEYKDKISTKLARILKQHIVENEIPNDGLLFYNQTKKEHVPVTEKAANSMIPNLFNKYIGKKIGSTLLRIAYASYHVFEKNPSLEERHTHAYHLGHKFDTFETYARKDLE